MSRIFPYVIFLWVITTCHSYSENLRYIQYDGFQLVVDCEKKSAIRFSYVISKDTGILKRRSSYSKDPDFSSDCQQNTSRPYSNATEQFDRGNLVPANHLDSLKLGIYQSNYVTNILPQAKNMNRGAWLRTEEIIECYRETNILRVYGGSIYNEDRSRDYFRRSHGIKTPSAFWKVIISKDNHIAWIIPNTSDARRSRLDDYIVPIEKIERETGEKFETIDKDKKPVPATTSWKIPSGCDLS